MEEVLLLFFIGLISGAYGIMVGAGGGFVLVPALLLLLKMPPELAAGTGLIVVLINAVSGVTGYVRLKRIEYRLTLFILVGTLPGSIIGIFIAQIIPAQLFYWIFAIILIILGLFLLWKNRGENQESIAESSITLTNMKKVSLILVGILMGTLSTFLGIGGGWLMVPILIYVYGIVPHRATATSVFTLCLYSTIGVVLHVYNGNVDWSAAMCAGAGALIGAQIGLFLSSLISGKLIINLLSFLLLVIGIEMLI